MKSYQAIFFDWDGTAVLSRSAPVEAVVEAMRPLLAKDVKLCIVSGTTYDKIAGGRLGELFPPALRRNLYLGLARGAYNYGFDDTGSLTLLGGVLPDKPQLLALHSACFALHQQLLMEHNLCTDIVFDRPNYCKLDLLCGVDRGEHLFLQDSEIALLQERLRRKGITGGVPELIAFAEAVGNREGIALRATCDAKYLEVGFATKSDNVNFLMQHLGLSAADCCFWGDEYLALAPGVCGSDAAMMTEETAGGDFFDVSQVAGDRPQGVTVVGGGVDSFLQFLREA